MKRFPLVFCLVLMFTALTTIRPASAEDFPDKVALQGDGADSRIVLTCRVLDFTGESIRLMLPTGTQEQTFPAAQVASIETPQTAGHRQGLTEFAQGDYAAARQELESALQEESRAWVRRDVLSVLVRCALQQGDYAAAGSYFVLLSASDPHTPAVRWIPLLWADGHLAPSLKSEARLWRKEANDYARLLAASVLLGDPDSRADAESDLRRLTVAGRTAAVRNLAEAQLWRTRLGADNLTAAEIDRWEQEVERLPEDLRGGPYYVLGQARKARREYDRAAAALLWLPLVSDHDPRLAARACLDAADALRTTGRRSEAATLYREIAERFRQTPSAAQALAALNELARPEPAPTE